MDDSQPQQALATVKNLLDRFGPINNAPVPPPVDVPVEPEFVQSGQPLVASPSELSDKAVYDKFLRLTKYIIAINSGENALSLASLLDRDLLPNNKNLKQATPELYKAYTDLLGLLKFMNLDVYPLNEIYDIVSDYLVLAFQNDIPVVSKFDIVLVAFNDFLLEGAIAENLAKAMMACKTKIGNVSLDSGDPTRPLPPTAGNWVKDYIQFSLSSPEGATSTLERIEYLRRNPVVQKLTTEEKKLVTELFKLYDWLLYGGNVEEQTRIPGLGAAGEYVNTQQFSLPPEGPALPQTFSQTKPALVQSAISDRLSELVREEQAPQVPFGPPQEIKPRAAAPLPNNKNLPEMANLYPGTPPTRSLPGAKPINIEEVIKRHEDEFQPGIKFGAEQMSTPAPSLPVAGKPQETRNQVDIDKKLEDLKKKLNL